MADWGLQAVIRANEHGEDQHQHQRHQDHDHDHCFGSIDVKKEYDQALLFCYPHLFDHANLTTSTTVVGDELDQLYKPFYPVFGTEIEFPPPPPPPPAAAAADLQIIQHHHDSDQEVQQHQEQDIVRNFRGSASNPSQLGSKLKKRKNQQKRVVVQVTADGLSSDPWAWRKYGQKPIKGSIYPRYIPVLFPNA
nr:WRKY11040 [Atractylodes chinensis]